MKDEKFRKALNAYTKAHDQEIEILDDITLGAAIFGAAIDVSEDGESSISDIKTALWALVDHELGHMRFSRNRPSRLSEGKGLNSI